MMLTLYSESGSGGGRVAVEDEVRAVIEVSDAALVTNDAELISGRLSDDWVYVGPAGITTKAELIGWIASGRLAHHSMTTTGPERIARLGDAVVFTARRTSTGEWDGAQYEVEEWISEVFVRGADGAWRAAFAQKSDVADG
jgi:ketosteroid isomerase-like protein